jgi:hypothetical protein
LDKNWLGYILGDFSQTHLAILPATQENSLFHCFKEWLDTEDIVYRLESQLTIVSSNPRRALS